MLLALEYLPEGDLLAYVSNPDKQRQISEEVTSYCAGLPGIDCMHA